MVAGSQKRHNGAAWYIYHVRKEKKFITLVNISNTKKTPTQSVL